MPADDTHAIIVPDTPAQNAPVPAKKKPYPIGLTRAAVKRLEGMLQGAEKTGKSVLFRGAIAFAWLLQLVADFRKAETDLNAGRSGTREVGDGLRDTTQAAQAIVDGTLSLVDVLYDQDIAGRGSFFPPEKGTQSLQKRLAAVIAGIEADKKRPEPLLPPASELPLLDTTKANSVLAALEADEAVAGGHAGTTDAALKQRNAVGDTIRAKLPKVEQFIRDIEAQDPQKLYLYGIRPLRHQLVPKRVTAAVKGKPGKAVK